MWWQQANGYEVYALHALMLPLVLVLYLRWIEAEEVAGGRADERSVRRARGRGRLFAILLGLAFTNHMTTGLLGPALLTHAVVSLGPSRATMRRFLALAPWWALGLLPYAYLPLRASAHPAIAWGDVGTWRGFIAHLTAWQYRVWMFADPATFREQLNYFLAVVPDDLAYGGLVLAVAGAWWLARRRGRLALLAGLMLVATVLYSCNYGIRDIDPYFLPALIALGVAATAGLTALRDAAGTRTALAVGALLVAGSAVLHYRACDESGNTLAHDLAANVLETLPPHALMLSTQWDYTVSPACYLQAVSGLRPDVLILDAELLRRSWYVRALGRKDAGLARRARPALDRFLRVVAPFEHGQPFDSAVIQDAYIGMVDALIDEAGATRPVFVTAEVDRRFGARYRRVPYQLALWLRAGDEYLPQPFPHYRFRPWRGHVDEDAATVHRIYGQALATRMEYEAATGHPAEARAYGRYALSFDPGYRLDRLPPLALDSADLLRDRIEFFEQLPERVRSLTAAADTAVAR